MRKAGRLDVVIVGGSIGGISCALALLKLGCNITVLEKASSITAAGAGIGLDETSIKILQGLSDRAALEKSIMPMTSEANRAVLNGQAHTIHQDDHWNHHSAHWSDIHQSLYRALPEGILHFCHTVTDVQQSGDGVTVTAESRAAAASGADDAPQVRTYHPDLVVAADGSMSQTRQRLRPNEGRRYSGYCAWRGVVPVQKQPQATAAVQAAYPDLDKRLYFDMAKGTHSVLYTLPGDRLNWLWYVNQSAPQLQGRSVTMKADEATIKEMHLSADKTFPPELAKLMQVTDKPFINAIYDREPLPQMVWDRVVLVGEAAHPTTPHGLRSTNMALADADQLRQSLDKHDCQIQPALRDFQDARLEATSREVLFSRYLGQLKQGLLYPDRLPESWLQQPSCKRQEMAQVSMSSFSMDKYRAHQLPPF